MFYEPLELTKRYLKISNELTALATVYGDFATLNNQMGTQRQAIRRVIDNLTAEKSSIETALKTLERVKL